MKFLPFKNLTAGIAEAIDNIFFNGVYADKEVERILKSNKKWGSRDRSFVAETIYDIVRWKRRAEAALEEEMNPENIYQIIGTHFILNGVSLPDWEEFKDLPDENILRENLEQTKSNFSIRESIPDWLDELGRKELENQWEKEIETMNLTAPTVIRANSLKTSITELKKSLESSGIKSKTIENFPDALTLKGKPNIRKNQIFKDGYFEIQDAGSQLIAPFLNPKPGMVVIDACAGAGGKSLHMAALMKNQGQIIAMDIYGSKLKELQRRAQRNGVKNIQTQLINSPETINDFKNTADKLLIDVPCSGLGVLSRNPGAKWKLSPQFIDKIKEVQQLILSEYSQMLKTGGIMVYATCSILPSENSEQVKKFLNNHTNFKLLEEQQLLPSEYGFDGFYMARIKKVD